MINISIIIYNYNNHFSRKFGKLVKKKEKNLFLYNESKQSKQWIIIDYQNLIKIHSDIHKKVSEVGKNKFRWMFTSKGAGES